MPNEENSNVNYPSRQVRRQLERRAAKNKRSHLKNVERINARTRRPKTR